MNADETVYSVEALKNLSDDELYQRLFKAWGITNGKIEVWGEIELNYSETWAGIRNIKTIPENREISYPLSGIDKTAPFIPPQEAKKLKGNDREALIKCELELSPKTQRDKHSNPFSLQVKRNSSERLILLPLKNPNELFEADTASFISTSVFEYHTRQLKDDLERENSYHEKKKEHLKIERDEYQKSLEEKLSSQKLEIKNTLKSLNKHKKDIEHEEEKLEKTTKGNQLLAKEKTNLENDIQEKQSQVTELIVQHQKVEQEMDKKIAKLKSYISEKAQFLKDFEFIDPDNFDSFIVDSVKERNTAEMLSFENILESDYKQAVSYIQSYLKEQDILYPRHVIENYLTLIGHGRDTSRLVPPVQIRTCATNAYGSYFEYLAQNRISG